MSSPDPSARRTAPDTVRLGASFGDIVRTRLRNLHDTYWGLAERARVHYQIAEVVLLLVAATVPIAGILTPGDSRLAAILGAVVTALTGLRSVFHWR